MATWTTSKCVASCSANCPASSAAATSNIEQISRSVAHHIKTIIGITTKVNVMEFESIPRTQTGKARRVLDQRPKQL